MLDHIPKQKHGLRVKHINLFDFVLDYLKSRKLLDKAIQMQREKGDEALKKALAGPLHEDKLAAVFAEVAQPEQHDLVIVSGVGSVWPLLRSHTPAEQPPAGHGQDAARDVLPRPIRRAVAPAVRQAQEQQLLPGLQAGSVNEADMLIKNLFERDIFRPINGVVKADQLDDSSVWQELDEFVITRELDQHFRKFIAWYLEAVDQGKNPDLAGKMGVWISGFFGSGKSHFLKVLSYLLRNRTHTHNGQSKQAVEFFESKVKDAMLFGDIKRAVAANTDVILFNIDSKADHRTGRDVILRVFLKVLNEMQGYSGDHPHIAHMERYLEGKGKLKAFHDAYREAHRPRMGQGAGRLPVQPG